MSVITHNNSTITGSTVEQFKPEHLKLHCLDHLVFEWCDMGRLQRAPQYFPSLKNSRNNTKRTTVLRVHLPHQDLPAALIYEEDENVMREKHAAR
jgi:hypothetical protein